MVMTGCIIVEGIGTEPCKIYGMALLVAATGIGSETLSLFLGL